MQFEGYDKRYGKIKQVSDEGKLYAVYEPNKLPFSIDYNSKLATAQEKAGIKIGNLNGLNYFLFQSFLMKEIII